MRMVCRFLTSRGKYHPNFPSEDATHKLKCNIIGIENIGHHWMVVWTDHKDKVRTNKWALNMVRVRRRGHVVFVSVGELEILLEFVDYDLDGRYFGEDNIPF